MTIRAAPATTDPITSTNKPTTRYFYDGQMCMEDDCTDTNGSRNPVDVTRYGLGARGIDRIEKTIDFYGSSPTTTVSYPVYDAHGNMVRTLSKNSGGYTVTSARIFGAWGEVRNSSGPSASKGRYVANLGHVQDDESGLIYMRARYYEPGLGRFVTEDLMLEGLNHYSYCRNNPMAYTDRSGKTSEEDKATKFGASALTALIALGWLLNSAVCGKGVEVRVLAWSGLAFLAAWFQMEYWTNMGQQSLSARLTAGGITMYCSVGVIGGALAFAAAAVSSSPASKAIDVFKTYSAIITLFISRENLETQ